MSTRQNEIDDLKTLSEQAGIVSGAFLSGLSEAFRDLNQRWLSEITPAEQRWQQLLDAYAGSYDRAASTAQQFRNAALANGESGIANIQDRWATHYQNRADAIRAPIDSAADRVMQIHRDWGGALSSRPCKTPRTRMDAGDAG